jgi:hypothetical protein
MRLDHGVPISFSISIRDRLDSMQGAEGIAAIVKS